jgi:SAM-dependent methyltransferase
VSAFDLALTGQRCWLVDSGGNRRRLPGPRWLAQADRADASLLARCAGPTVDVGCGPGRMVAALAARGVVALGVDISPLAVRLTVQRGAVALRRNVFDRLPGEGRWRHVLLADTNIGIGGNPVDLLDRCAELVVPGGTVLVELDPAVTGVRRCVATVEHDGHHGEPFHWATVGPDAVESLAAAVGLTVTGTWRRAGRSFAELRTGRT